jgi:hypothetical protein
MQRLAFIRYLYQLAVEQSQQPDPMAAASILAFHDSVELFLQLALEQPGVTLGTKNPNFDQYWGMQLPKGALTQQVTMQKLNRVRVDLKHHGIMPSRSLIDEFRIVTTLFFEENTVAVFGLAFDEVSMAYLVQNANAREHLENAEQAVKTEDFVVAMDEIAIAFDELTRQRRRMEADKAFKRREASSSRLNNAYSLSISNTREGNYIQEIENHINSIEDALEIIRWGLDLPLYNHFVDITPRVGWYADGKRRLHPRRRESPTSDDCLFCFNFVITSALRLQELPVY